MGYFNYLVSYLDYVKKLKVKLLEKLKKNFSMNTLSRQKTRYGMKVYARFMVLVHNIRVLLMLIQLLLFGNDLLHF